jgi:predicted TIM-barrel fold metal-dependent hydrolase
MQDNYHAANADRRTFLRLMSAIGAASLAEAAESADAIESVHAPWSSGSEVARTKAPPNAADCHHHIYDSRFPVDAKAVLRPLNATVADYRLLQKRIGTTRHVVVQPSTYGVDNRCMLDAVQQFGLATTRGIAVVNESISKIELRRMDAAGVRGIRFNLQQAGATTLDMLDPLSKRVAEFGWHVEINASPAQIATNEGLWHRIAVDVVFDHLAHVPVPANSNAAFATIGNLLQTGKAWVKLSGAYMDTKIGPPSYSDAGAVAKAYIKEAPERLVWGTDWPHPTIKSKPDDALLFDLLADWAPGESTRTQILVDNPAKLYRF